MFSCFSSFVCNLARMFTEYCDERVVGLSAPISRKPHTSHVHQVLFARHCM